MKLSDGTEYFRRPPSGGIKTVGKSVKAAEWYDDDDNIWEPVKIEGKGMFWRKKAGK